MTTIANPLAATYNFKLANLMQLHTVASKHGTRLPPTLIPHFDRVQKIENGVVRLLFASPLFDFLARLGQQT